MGNESTAESGGALSMLIDREFEPVFPTLSVAKPVAG
jgi:hypothetical protein